MCACTDLHSALMFPSPKPVAPRRSISSRKKVSSVKMGLVNTWRRYLETESSKVSVFSWSYGTLRKMLTWYLHYKIIWHTMQRCEITALDCLSPSVFTGCCVPVQVCVQENAVLCQDLRVVSCLLDLLLFAHLSQHRKGRRSVNHRRRLHISHIFPKSLKRLESTPFFFFCFVL